MGVVVHKFGGTTLSTTGAGHVVAADILIDDLRERGEQTGLKQAVVVSALAGTTDTLLRVRIDLLDFCAHVNVFLASFSFFSSFIL